MRLLGALCARVYARVDELSADWAAEEGGDVVAAAEQGLRGDEASVGSPLPPDVLYLALHHVLPPLAALCSVTASLTSPGPPASRSRARFLELERPV